MNTYLRGAVPFFAACLILANAPNASAQVAPPLGVAEQFGALGNSGVSGSTGAGTQVTGDVGSSPTATVTNFPPSTAVGGFTVHTTNNGTVIQAHLDAIVAFNQMTGQPGGVAIGPQMNGLVLTSGVYDLGAADLANGGTLTLNGPGVFIFRTASTLTMNTNSNVVGSANPCNVFWQVGTSATLNGITFRGTVVAAASISLASTGNVTGRLLAGTGPTGAVTMAGAGGNTIGGCSTVVVPPIPPGPGGPPVPALPDLAAAGLLAALLVSGVFLARR
jgi:hypothetical protein